MDKKIAVIHTSLVFFQKELLLFQLLAEILPEVKLMHIIDEKILSEVMARGSISPAEIRRMCLYVLAADSMEVDAIFSVCSSLGPAMDIAKNLVSIPVVKIDEGMAQKAAEEGKKITVLATVPTTVRPTVNLIKEKAAKIGTSLEIREAVATGAFEYLMDNQRERHDDMVLNVAKEAAKSSDMLVLAQASMARLAPRISDEVGLPVLSSPRLGVEYLKTILG
jgi:Asp/Glu/hydantoin racemase